jgi:hypothetical protein
LLGPLGPRGLRCASSLLDSQSPSCLSKGSAHGATESNRALRGSLPVVWETSRRGNDEAAQEPHSWARTIRTQACPRVVSDCRNRLAALWSREAQALRSSHEEERRLRGRGPRSAKSAFQSGETLLRSVRRAKRRREPNRGGKVAGSMKDGVEPEDAITERWKALRVVDIV